MIQAGSHTASSIPDIETFLKHDEEKELLRFTTAGSVDDGKSTLIGRLLYDSKGVYEDQLASVKKASASSGAVAPGTMDFALLTDGLRAEREQGITIDVAYRYFATAKRKFIIADTPGHEQYTRNMATGASTANLTIILVDARKGVLVQSRRHAMIASLLAIPHLVVAVNKMDLVDYSEEVFERIREEFTDFVTRLNVTDVQFIPISALQGDNVVTKSGNMPWYQGPALLHHLETVHIASDRNLTEMRMPVQYVLRAGQDFRGFTGQLASGILHEGDAVMILPSGKTAHVKSLVSYDGPLQMAFAPMPVTVTLDQEVDISRGDMLVPPLHAPHVAQQFDARLIWMNQAAFEPGRNYLLKHTTRTVKAKGRAIRYKISMQTLERQHATKLELNEIGAVVIETHQPVFFDPYKRNRATGSFILIDPITNATVGAGMITGRQPAQTEVQQPMSVDRAPVSALEREMRFGHRAMLFWLEGGTREAALAVERSLFEQGCHVVVVAPNASADVLAACAAAVLDAGAIALFPGASSVLKEAVRAAVGDERFVETRVGPGDGIAEAISSVYQKLRSQAILREDR